MLFKICCRCLIVNCKCCSRFAIDISSLVNWWLATPLSLFPEINRRVFRNVNYLLWCHTWRRWGIYNLLRLHIDKHSRGSANKYVLFVFVFVFVCVDLLLLLLLLLRARTRGAAFELLCVVAPGNILTHSQLPLPPQLLTLSPHSSTQVALLGFVRASSVGAVFASFGYVRNYCAQCLKNVHVARTISQ